MLYWYSGRRWRCVCHFCSSMMEIAVEKLESELKKKNGSIVILFNSLGGWRGMISWIWFVDTIQFTFGIFTTIKIIHKLDRNGNDRFWIQNDMLKQQIHLLSIFWVQRAYKRVQACVHVCMSACVHPFVRARLCACARRCSCGSACDYCGSARAPPSLFLSDHFLTLPTISNEILTSFAFEPRGRF